MARKNILPTEL
jgi:hypothetical protein